MTASGTAPIRAGELVMVWGGTAWSRAQLDAGEVPPCSFSFIDDDVLLAGPEDGLDYFVNHSCDPSVWMAGGHGRLAPRHRLR